MARPAGLTLGRTTYRRCYQNRQFRSKRRRHRLHKVVERKQGVWNLSSQSLSPCEIQVLALGLTFSPTPTLWPPKKLEADLTEFCRKMRLAFVFAKNSKSGPNTDNSSAPLGQEQAHNPAVVADRIFPVKSDWNPGPLKGWMDGELWMDKFTRVLRKKILAGKPKSFNLPANHRQALRSLSSRSGVVIKKADKGSPVVVMNQQDYCEEAFRQLSNPEYYQEIPVSLCAANTLRIKAILESMRLNKVVDKKTLSFLMPPVKAKSRQAYFLPKIHKEQSKWWRTSTLNTLIPQGRPIISNVGTETSASAKYLDFYLQPTIVGLPALVQDSYEFVGKLDLAMIGSENVTLVTADIKDLYTNISQDAAFECMSNWIKQSSPGSGPFKESLIELMRVQLYNNDIEFDGRFFKQILGVSMGWSPAPTVANYFLKELDELILSYNPLLYKRFIDDVFLVWDNTCPGLDELMLEANRWNSKILLLWQTNQEQATFLDVEVFKDDSPFLKHRVHFKETDTHALLHHTSCHVIHTFKGIVKSQLIRFHRLCSDRIGVEGATKILFQVLLKRGYSKGMLTRISADVEKCLLEGNLIKDLTERAPDLDNNQILPIPVPYSSELSELAPWIHSQWQQLMLELPEDQTWLPQELTVAWRKNDTLKDSLVRTRFTPF